MSKKPLLSADEIIKILDKKFDFLIISQKGSHVKLKKKEESRERVTIVPIIPPFDDF